MAVGDELDPAGYHKATNNISFKISEIVRNSTADHTRESIRNEREHMVAICHKVWIKFSEKHQKSPSHVNNNVHSCCRRGKIPANVDKSTIRKAQTETARMNNAVTLAKVWTTYFKKATRILGLIGWFFKFIIFLVSGLFIFYSLLVLHRPTQGYMSRHTQDLIYPFLRTLRLITLPIIWRFPILTDFYEESCLFSNPFFSMDNLDCWPCETARHVVDLTGFTNFSSAYHHSGIPFIVKDAFKTEVGISDIRKIYIENSEKLDKVFLESNLNGVTTFDDLFRSESNNNFDRLDLHIKWKINRVTLVRLLRQYFPKPYFVPVTTEVSVQHFLFIDEARSRTYPLPFTEFANVFLTQASGSRYVVLIPTKNCHYRCKVVSIVLQPKDVLFYNWLFWRPMSVPVESSSSNLSVTYVGSFY